MKLGMVPLSCSSAVWAVESTNTGFHPRALASFCLVKVPQITAISCSGAMLAGDLRHRRHWDASLLDVLRSGDVRWNGYRLLQEGVPNVQISPYANTCRTYVIGGNNSNHHNHHDQMYGSCFCSHLGSSDGGA